MALQPALHIATDQIGNICQMHNCMRNPIIVYADIALRPITGSEICTSCRAAIGTSIAKLHLIPKRERCYHQIDYGDAKSHALTLICCSAASLASDLPGRPEFDASATRLLGVEPIIFVSGQTIA